MDSTKPLSALSADATARRLSQTASSVTSMQRATMSGIGAAVQRTAQREEMLRHIAEGTRTLREENGHMESILSEEHRMLSNEDVCAILNQQFVGITQSSLLASRKPPVRLPCRQHRTLLGGSRTVGGLLLQSGGGGGGEGGASAMELETQVQTERRRDAVATVRGLQPSALPATTTPNAVPMGSVNYRVLLEQQQEMHQKMQAATTVYRDLVKEVVRTQQRIGEGIV